MMGECRGIFEIQEWSMNTSDSGNLPRVAGDILSDDWRLRVGYLGHGNIPHFWNPEKQCWLPANESMTDQDGPPGGDPPAVA
jgi:hypothetical protein